MHNAHRFCLLSCGFLLYPSLQNHLQEAENQAHITSLLESEHAKWVSSLRHWVGVLSVSGPLSSSRDIPTSVRTDEALNRLLVELEPLSPLTEAEYEGEANTGGPNTTTSSDKMFVATAVKPGTLCALALQLVTCEFYYCQSVCFANSHTYIVQVLRDARVIDPSPALILPTPLNPHQQLVPPPPGRDCTPEMLESRFNRLRVLVDDNDARVSDKSHHNRCCMQCWLSVVNKDDSQRRLPPVKRRCQDFVSAYHPCLWDWDPPSCV